MKLMVQPGTGILPVVNAIRKARRYIDVCIFRLDRQEIVRALAETAKRGVRVRALIAHTNSAGNKRLREIEQNLLAGGVTVARTSDDLLRYHGKYMVADDVLHLFGFNFTKQDIDRSRSFGLITRDRRAVKEALSLFQADLTRQVYTPSRSNLVVSPESAREMLSKFIRGARHQLAIYDIKIQDPGMIRLLKDLTRHGVEVRLLGSMKDSDDVKVRALKGIRLHVRTIIRDGTRVFVGSMSLRKPELERRREVGLLVSNPAVARKILEVFEADWKTSETGQDRDAVEAAVKESAAVEKAAVKEVAAEKAAVKEAVAEEKAAVKELAVEKAAEKAAVKEAAEEKAADKEMAKAG
jgi:phosphatidylserine/phosphatidylglycerophosphate/cardiolipin synthase-like enzyme